MRENRQWNCYTGKKPSRNIGLLPLNQPSINHQLSKVERAVERVELENLAYDNDAQFAKTLKGIHFIDFQSLMRRFNAQF